MVRLWRAAPGSWVSPGGPEPSVESMPALRHGFPEAAAHGLAQQNPGTNVADAGQSEPSLHLRQ